MKVLLKKIHLAAGKLLSSSLISISSLVVLKTAFQIIVINSGLRWLTADDYSRTVISWDWLQQPRIYSGVWLSLHFWIDGIFIWLFKDLTLAPVLCNTFFSLVTIIYLYLLVSKIFGKSTAYITCVIFAVFPFQVWLSTSGMPESIFFAFITISFYYYILWYESAKAGKAAASYIFLAASCLSLNIANLLRYEGWFFSITLIIITAVISVKKFRFSKQTDRKSVV